MAEKKKNWDDLIAFSDPFTDSRVRIVSGRSRLEMVRNGREVCYELLPESGAILAKHRSRTYNTVRSLLASEDFANIARYIETQRRQFERQSNVPAIPSYVRIGSEFASVEQLADQLTENNEKSRLILLDGPAGVGKTYHVEQLTKMQMERCARGIAVPPLLNITSHGRRLSNFRDVLAATTQQMGAAFGSTQVAILVRHSILIAAIDGFDELVDADGYEDAWLSLRNFIDEIGVGGTIILAARDTFVEQQELLSRINRADGSVSLVMAHVQPVRPQDAKEWLSKAPKWKVLDIESSLTNDVLREGSYALRPFFLKTIAEAGGWADVVDSGLRTYLTNSLIRREAKLIAQQLGGVTAEQVVPALVHLFQEIALEMAVRETDLIEISHLTFLVNYCFDELFDEKSIRKLMHKAGSFSLLESTLEKEKRSFTHSEIKNYFYAGALIKSLQNRAIPLVLRRTALVGEHLDVFAEVFSNDEMGAKKGVEYLSTAVNSELSNDSFAANGGAILILAFSLGLLDRLDYISVVDAMFASGYPTGDFVESEVSRLDFSSANVSKVLFKDVKVGTLVINDATRFGDSLPDFDALEIRSANGATIERDREKIKEHIKSHLHSDKQEKYSSSDSVYLLEKIARRAVRYFYLREHGDDDDGSILLKDERWKLVRNILENFGRIEIKKGKPMHGRPSPLIRLINPKALLDYNDSDTQMILDEIIIQEKG